MAVSYEAARAAYLDSFSHLLDASSATAPQMTFRGESGLSQDALAERANDLAAKSNTLTEATAAYLKSANVMTHANAAGSLLEQATADLTVARTLWEIIEAGVAESSGEVYRSVDSVNLRMMASSLQDTLPVSLEDIRSLTMRSAGLTPQTIDDAITALRSEIESTLELIEQRVTELSTRTARELLRVAFNQWNLVITGAKLVGSGAGAGEIVQTVEKQIDNAFHSLANALGKLVGSVVGKIVALIQTNKQTQDVIIDMLQRTKDKAQGEGVDAFGVMVRKILGIRSFVDIELDIWLNDASKDVQRVNEVAAAIAKLRDGYSLLASQAEKLMDLIASGSVIASAPPLMAIAFGLQVGLLTTVVFAGYDYIDVGGRGLNITRGVKEILVTQLQVSEAARVRAAEAVKAARAAGTPSNPTTTG